jgi:hypothetical protein
LARDSDSYDGISHGYAPHGAPSEEKPVPLSDLVRQLVDEANATVKAEVALLKARGELATQGAKKTSIWGIIALMTATVALLAFAFGVILALATLVGPLAATAIVVAALLLVSALAAWRAKAGVSDLSVAFRRNLFGEGDVE